MSQDNERELREQWEVRVVALLLGEASAFEEAELEERFKTDAELAAFYQQMKQVIGLVQRASTKSNSQPETVRVQRQLSPERRQALLDRFRTSDFSEKHPADTPVAAEKRIIRFWPSRPWRVAAAVAACLLVLLGLAAISIPMFSGRTEMAKMAAPASRSGQWFEQRDRTVQPATSVPASPREAKPGKRASSVYSVAARGYVNKLQFQTNQPSVTPSITAGGIESPAVDASQSYGYYRSASEKSETPKVFLPAGEKKVEDLGMMIPSGETVSTTELGERGSSSLFSERYTGNASQSDRLRGLSTEAAGRAGGDHSLSRALRPTPGGTTTDFANRGKDGDSGIERERGSMGGGFGGGMGGMGGKNAGSFQAGIVNTDAMAVRQYAAEPVELKVREETTAPAAPVVRPPTSPGIVQNGPVVGDAPTLGRRLQALEKTVDLQVNSDESLAEQRQSASAGVADALGSNGRAAAGRKAARPAKPDQMVRSGSGLAMPTARAAVERLDASAIVATPAVPLPAQQVKGGTVIQPSRAVESTKPLGQEWALADDKRFGVVREGASDEQTPRGSVLAKDKRLGAVQAGNTILFFDVNSGGKAKQDQALKYTSNGSVKLGNDAGNTEAGYRIEERSARAIDGLSVVQQEREREGIEVKKERALKEPSPPLAEPLPEILTRDNAFSTFSLNVSDVSFKLAAASLEKGAMPEPGTIRSEEFVNAFDYHDPTPTAAARVGFVWDRAQYPFAHNRDILRFSLKTAAQGREAGKALNLVILLDNSGSMERADRVRILQEALKVLAWQLQPQDRVSVVAFARTAHLWVDGLSGAQPEELLKRVMNLNPEGGTNLEDALNLAYATALRHFLSQGNNRVIMLTDGAANLGNVDPEALRKTIETHRRKGVALDCFGIGWEGYNDYMLATLSKYGDGRYGFLNRPETVNSEFAAQLAGALHVAAADVKAQVEFNPLRVVLYRQIGYAQHQLTQEQFRDNTVDAAEIGAAESGNALYVIQTDPKGSGPIATVRVRFKIPTTGEYAEKEWIIPWQPSVRALDQSAPAMRLAVVSAAFAEWLANSPYAGEVTLSALDRFLNGVSIVYQPDPRPAQLEGMIRQARSLTGK